VRYTLLCSYPRDFPDPLSEVQYFISGAPETRPFVTRIRPATV